VLPKLNKSLTVGIGSRTCAKRWSECLTDCELNWKISRTRLHHFKHSCRLAQWRWMHTSRIVKPINKPAAPDDWHAMTRFVLWSRKGFQNCELPENWHWRAPLYVILPEPFVFLNGR